MYSTEKIGQLDCVIVGSLEQSSAPKLVVLLCHGFGAPGDDLVPLAEEILGATGVDPGLVTFVFPAAPIVLDAFGGYEGRAWWMINMQKLSEMMQTNDFSQLCNAVPPGIVEAREMLLSTIREIFDRTNLSWGELILGGFSQGAMLTADTVFNSDENPLRLVQMSGTLICKDQWEERIRGHEGLRVLQSHGTIDPVLPYAAAEWLRDLFLRNQCEVDFTGFHGVHTIPMEGLRKLAEVIVECTRTDA